jgi:hypothetical protein
MSGASSAERVIASMQENHLTTNQFDKLFDRGFQRDEIKSEGWNESETERPPGASMKILVGLAPIFPGPASGCTRTNPKWQTICGGDFAALFPLLRTIQRDDRPVHQGGWRRDLSLIS